MNSLTDEERIKQRQETHDILVNLAEQKKVTLDRKLELHSECRGTGRLNGQPCRYCAGSGRVVRLSVFLTVPFTDV